MSSAFHSRCVVEIGGIPIGVRSGDNGLLALVEKRYSGFLASSSPDFEIELLRIDRPISNPDDDVRVERDGGDWVVTRGDFCARWNPLSGRGTVRRRDR